MTECRQIESLLPPFVDGEADAHTIQRVESHLATCAACRSWVEQERTARAVLRARAPALAVIAPPGLRTRVVATLEAQGTPRTVGTLGTLGTLGWRGRFTAFAAAALLLLVTACALEFVTTESNALYAAQLAIDHVRCFFVEHTTTQPADARQLQQDVARKYGWSIAVPPSSQAADLTLVAARRCPFWLGPHAHLLYRTGDRHVSLYVTPGAQRRDDTLRVLGHGHKLWTSGSNSYALVTDGLTPAEQARISAYLEAETRAN